MSAFTSDLSVADFALCDRLQLTPLSQVMGNSIYQVGYQNAGHPGEGGDGIRELHVLSQAWNEARKHALGRMRDEADRVGASAVVGVDIDSGAIDLTDSGGTAIQYAARGTAVLRKGAPAGPAALTELSVADYSNLLEAGVEPLGVVAHTSVFFVTWSASWLSTSSRTVAPRQSFEQRRLTRCFYTARERVMSEVGGQAADLHASGIVGMRVEHGSHSQVFKGLGGADVSGVMITVNAMGTAISESARGGPQVRPARDAKPIRARHAHAGDARSPRIKTTVDLLG